MGTFTFLPHTADIRMLVEAPSLEDLFATAARGMASILLGGENAFDDGEPATYTMRIKSIDLTVLLVDFLSDVLTASHENRAVYNAVEIQSMDLNHVEAILKGRVIERFDEDIKAVTYHEADVTRDRNGNWRSMIIFDI